ncbi:rRNA maturation RNase YbeY [Desulfobacterales bacterium HSG16]|nr:rRNA maturation RNase YbeY [Desulfobacterales bacterium HSG16]
MIRIKAQAILNALESPEAELSIVIVDDDAIWEMNREYLDRDRPTNVISFPMQEGEFPGITPDLLGDVVISADTTHKEAENAKISFIERFDQLLVHGILHLFGYDHEQAEEEALIMEEKSRFLLNELGALYIDEGFAIESKSPRQTHDAGVAVGRAISENVIFALTGDLGAGKTAFVRGLARGLGVDPNCPVTSPTYTLINEYQGRISLFHVDLYRLSSSADFEDIGIYDIMEEKGVVAIEWADRLEENDDMPSEYIDICFEYARSEDDYEDHYEDDDGIEANFRYIHIASLGSNISQQMKKIELVCQT